MTTTSVSTSVRIRPSRSAHACLAVSVLGPVQGAAAAGDPGPRAIVVGTPDAMIGLPPGSFGNDIYSADGSGQVKRVRIKAGDRTRLKLGFENDGPSCNDVETAESGEFISIRGDFSAYCECD